LDTKPEAAIVAHYLGGLSIVEHGRAQSRMLAISAVENGRAQVKKPTKPKRPLIAQGGRRRRAP
jgi:hypothetical protein